METLRFRGLYKHDLPPFDFKIESIPKKTYVSLKSKTFLKVLMLLSFFYLCILEFSSILPKPLMMKDERLLKDRFIAERAMNHVQNLTNLGPRPVGSFANEVLAVNFFYKEIDLIMRKSHRIHRIAIDLQKASGSFPLLFLDGMTSVYRNVQNVIVKIGPTDYSANSILVNCHYDTVVDSPGGSDDAASCAVMLEVLRVIAMSSVPLKNNIIFLFNGAEENLLQGSHAFITQHKWSNEIKCFVNLEACGAGGRELLFQAGPENPWLLEAYARHVKSPVASTLAEEVFQSGLIPGDTDFRIFRDFGNIPGLDFAWTSNGYVYHTKHDNPKHIPLGALQHTGDNILPVVLHLANIHYSEENLETKGNLVYFDIFGLYIIRMQNVTSMLINFSIALIALLTIYNNSKVYSAHRGQKKRTYFLHTCLCSCIMCFSWIFSFLTSVIIASILTSVNRAMSWYSTPAWIFFLYSIPSLLSSILIVSSFGKWQMRNVVFTSSWSLQKLNSDAFNLILVIIILSCMILKLRSGFVAALWLTFLLIGNAAKEFCYTCMKGEFWMWSYILVLIFPFSKGCYVISSVFKIVIPIMGRSGSGNHAESVLAFISSALTLCLTYFLVPLVVLIDTPKKIIKTLLGTTVIAMLALLLTPLGFPYSANNLAPTPQRYMILHVLSQSQFNGQLTSEKSGFWVVDLDVNSPHIVESFVSEMSSAELVTDCNSQLYCGLPYIIPVKTLIWKTHWIVAPKPTIFIPTELELVEKTYTSSNVIKYVFSALGPDHMTLMFSPIKGVGIKATSFINTKLIAGPKWRERETYFIYYSCASNPTPWTFNIDFKVPQNFSNDHLVVDIALSGHFIHGANQRSVRLTKLLAQFPPWAVTTGWTAKYTSYKF